VERQSVQQFPPGFARSFDRTARGDLFGGLPRMEHRLGHASGFRDHHRPEEPAR